jgi:hypothetical protein
MKPIGLGGWVAFESALHPGGKEKDLEVAIERAYKMGMSWVSLRGGAGGANDASFDKRTVEAWKNAKQYDGSSFGVYVWIFAYPGTVEKEISGYKKFLDLGVDGAIINAEFEIDTDAYTEEEKVDKAKRLVEGIRKVGYDFVAHAPPDYRGSESPAKYVDGKPFDVWYTFDELCDMVMPQVYAWEHNDSGHLYHLSQVVRRYKNRPQGVQLEKVQPVMCTYRPKTRGFRKNVEGRYIPISTPKIDDEAKVVARDLLEGLMHPWVQTSQAPSLYSLDAITFINGASDEVVGGVATLEAERRHLQVWNQVRAWDPDNVEWRPSQDAQAFIDQVLFPPHSETLV